MVYTFLSQPFAPLVFSADIKPSFLSSVMCLETLQRRIPTCLAIRLWDGQHMLVLSFAAIHKLSRTALVIGERISCSCAHSIARKLITLCWCICSDIPNIFPPRSARDSQG